MLAFGFLASQEVKDAGVGNLGLHDREHSGIQRDRRCNVWLYRAYGTSLDTKVYSRIRWRFVESHHVSEEAPFCNAEPADNVTVSWGQSAGSISVSMQMLANGGNTEGLFRAAFMQSGSPLPVGDITHVGAYITNSLNF